MTYVGRSVIRKEDERFLRGEGRFVADATEEALHIAFVRSTHASAQLLDVDVSRARAAPGVVEVFDGATFSQLAGPLQPIYLANNAFVDASGFHTAALRVDALAIQEVRYVGEPVVAVVATNRYLAEDAAERVEVAYGERRAVLHPQDALKPGAPQVRPECIGNVAAGLVLKRGSVPSGPVEVTGTYRIGRHSGVPLECRGTLAEWSHDGIVHLTTSTQVPNHVRRALCHAAGWDDRQLRVIAPDVGGGFGPKANVYGEELVTAVLARHLRRNVCWVEDRTEHLIGTAHSRDRQHNNRLVVDRDGLILGYEDDFVVDIGAHNLWLAGVTANSAIHGLGPYRIPAFRMSGRAVVTNKTPTTQYRGAGRPEACFALERVLDKAAGILGISSEDIRRRNLLRREDMPYEVGVLYHDGRPIVYDGGDYSMLLETCLGELERQGEPPMLDERDLVGVGLAMFAEGTGLGPYEDASASLMSGGGFTVWTGAACSGMSHETTLAQIAADNLAAPIEVIHVGRSDTSHIPDGIGSYASRTAVNAGSAVLGATQELVDRAKGLVAARLDTSGDPATIRLDPSGFFIHEPSDAKMSWTDLAEVLGATIPGADSGRVLSAEYRFTPPTVTWTAGAHAATVSVDAESGLTRVTGYIAVDESGTLINPEVVRGQIEGGVAQAIGGTLMEEFVFDGNGQPLTATLADYLLPSASDVPRITSIHLLALSKGNPLGVRGVGESGTIPGYAAISSAVDNALGQGHVSSTPIHPESVRAQVRTGSEK